MNRLSRMPPTRRCLDSVLMSSRLFPLFLGLQAWLSATYAAPNDGLVGSYLRAELGRSSFSVGAVAGPSDDRGHAGKLFYGYRFNEQFGVELGYAQLGNFSRSVRGVGPVATGTEEGRARSIFTVGTGRLALEDHWATLGRVGLSLGQVRVGGAAAGKTSPLLGFGLEFRPWPGLSFTLNADHYGELANGFKARSLFFGFHFTL